MQNVMCSILRTPQKSLRQVREVRMWLSTITRRLCLNTLRSAGRQRRRLTRIQGGAALDAAEASWEGVRTTDLPPAPEVVRAMDSLPRRLREVVYLKHIGSLTFDQIATSLGRNRSTLATQYQSGIALLREMLAHSDRTIPAPPASIGVGP